MSIKISRIFTALLAIVCLGLASYFILLGSGFFPKPTISLVLLLSFFMIALSRSKKAFWFILMPLVCIHAFYAPTGLNFGPPSYQYIASVFATDMLETWEYLLQIPLSSYLIAISIPLLVMAYRQLILKSAVDFFKNSTFIVLSSLLLAYHLPIADFMKESISSSVKVLDEVQKLKQLSQQSNWGSSQLENSKYDDYVLIIGESARRDYHQVYGYPIENTPFISQSKGTIIDGLTSAGTNTIASLRLMLTLPNKEKWEPNYDLSLIDLVKSAGIKTYWLSNQGFLGEFDTPIASLASKADEVVFLKKGGSFNSTNYSDFDLLPKLEQVLVDQQNGKRFIVLHIYGSHPLACDRIEDYHKIFKDGEIDKKYDYLNCYISSIKKTDEFLKRVYQDLVKNEEKTHRSFSMIYFSDHGLCHQEDDKAGILFNQNCFSQFHHQVPLFKLSSDDSEQHQYQVFKSGLNFVEGIANWIGIKNPKLSPQFDLFSNQSDPSDYGLSERIKLKYRKDPDPAKDIRSNH